MKHLILYCLVAFLMTLSGSLLPVVGESWAHRHLWRLLAFSSGVLLAIAFLHLIPESFSLAGRMGAMTLLATFAALFAAENVTMVHSCAEFLEPPRSSVVSLSSLIALTIHALVDGVAIGVGLRQSLVLGSVISAGVILHKFSDGLTLTSLLHAAGTPRWREATLGTLLALATPLGAVVSYLSAGQMPGPAIGMVLALAAGSFLYVAAADLLPRLHEAHDRWCLLFFLFGILAVGSFS